MWIFFCVFDIQQRLLSSLLLIWSEHQSSVLNVPSPMNEWWRKTKRESQRKSRNLFSLRQDSRQRQEAWKVSLSLSHSPFDHESFLNNLCSSPTLDTQYWWFDSLEKNTKWHGKQWKIGILLNFHARQSTHLTRNIFTCRVKSLAEFVCVYVLFSETLLQWSQLKAFFVPFEQ